MRYSCGRANWLVEFDIVRGGERTVVTTILVVVKAHISFIKPTIQLEMLQITARAQRACSNGYTGAKDRGKKSNHHKKSPS